MKIFYNKMFDHFNFIIFSLNIYVNYYILYYTIDLLKVKYRNFKWKIVVITKIRLLL